MATKSTKKLGLFFVATVLVIVAGFTWQYGSRALRVPQRAAPITLSSSASGPQDARRDPQGRPYDAPPGVPVENGRVPVLSEGRQVGWADAFDIFGPPAGSWDELPPPKGGPAAVYDRSDQRGRRIGTLGPNGFRPDSAGRDTQESDSSATTVVHGDGD